MAAVNVHATNTETNTHRTAQAVALLLGAGLDLRNTDGGSTSLDGASAVSTLVQQGAFSKPREVVCGGRGCSW